VPVMFGVPFQTYELIDGSRLNADENGIIRGVPQWAVRDMFLAGCRPVPLAPIPPPDPPIIIIIIAGTEPEEEE
jgi:hypothetical protein